MEREFKFRAWHNETEQMLFVGDSFGTKHPLDCVNYARQGQDVVLMQYVGLKDKNGKEIYESDIIKVKDFMFAGYCESIDGGLTAGEKYEDLIETVQWSDAAFFLSDMPLHAVASEDLEVIGNIYQNPELINKATS